MRHTSVIDAQHNLTAIAGPIVLGFGLLVAFFVGFGYWALSAPLSGAVVASGRVAKQGDTQKVSHERGGVIAAISVQEGQKVNNGDLLVLIKDANGEADYDELTAKIASLEIREFRLVAEDTKQTKFTPSEILKNLKHNSEVIAWIDDIDAMFADQVREFDSRRQLRVQEKTILEAQRQSLERELAGVRAETTAVLSQVSILKEQRASREELMKQGYGRKIDLQSTQRNLAQVEGQLAQLQARSQMLPSQIDEMTARWENVDRSFMEQVSKELSNLRVEKLALMQQLKAAQNAVSRVEVRAPASGVINKIHVNTIGSAIGAFQPIIEIVPDNNAILVEVEIDPADIEQVRVGQVAKLVLSGYDQADVDPVPGKVKFVSPDSRMNEQTQMPYFVARLELDPNVEGIPEMSSGMPVEAYMETGDRTFAEIMLEPITKSLRRAFRS